MWKANEGIAYIFCLLHAEIGAYLEDYNKLCFNFSQVSSFTCTVILQQHISAPIKSAAYCAVTPYDLPL